MKPEKFKEEKLLKYGGVGVITENEVSYKIKDFKMRLYRIWLHRVYNLRIDKREVAYSLFRLCKKYLEKHEKKLSIEEKLFLREVRLNYWVISRNPI